MPRRPLARRLRPWIWSALTLVAGGVIAAGPGVPWAKTTAEAVHLDPDRLRAFTERVGGHGVIVRNGHLVVEWGEAHRRADVASACKPVLMHLLLEALARGRLRSLGDQVSEWEPRLAALNPELGGKDRGITWRHLVTQTSGYGLRESPGTAFAYNDWQMALLADLLVERVFESPWAQVDAQVLGPMLTGPLGCEDNPTLLAFGEKDRPGRLAISPRDFARFGQLYLQRGQWNGKQLFPKAWAEGVVRAPLDPRFPRADRVAAAMLPGARSLGSREIPDNQTEHAGSYSFLWWVNGVDAVGRRRWAAAPDDAFAALGHGGRRALWVLPSLGLVVSWNDARVSSVAQENEVLGWLCAAVLDQHEKRTARAERPAAEPGARGVEASERRRVIIETDAGGDPDDEQSLVRFLLYANEWEVEGLIANRARARAGENRNEERTGVGIVRRLVDAYAACWPRLVEHDPRYPRPEALRAVVKSGCDDEDTAVDWILRRVDDPDPRPIWYSDWGSDHGSSTNNMRRALDRVWRERGPEGYAQFKSRLRLVSADAFAQHTFGVEPPFALWVDTWRPEIEGRRWYHRFSALTSKAGGFDLRRDCLTGHGPLGALYPTNTGMAQKEGDSLSFLYLVPNGMNEPTHPEWGGWGGRLGLQPGGGGRSYFWANVADAWRGGTHRDHTLARWATDLQSDFRARLDWCVQPREGANHPPVLEGVSPVVTEVAAGSVWERTADRVRDPDGDAWSAEWIHYPEAGTFPGAVGWRSEGLRLRVDVPEVDREATVHFILRVTDEGSPPLSRYRRYILRVHPR
ncbi:MAG: DUF1593 domain-containing protein [Verrucomicrobiales bacterium]|nr:DUF1593 domain-containing protein [Verrucomicrobiales bacterium]